MVIFKHILADDELCDLKKLLAPLKTLTAFAQKRTFSLIKVENKNFLFCSCLLVSVKTFKKNLKSRKIKHILFSRLIAHIEQHIFLWLKISENALPAT